MIKTGKIPSPIELTRLRANELSVKAHEQFQNSILPIYGRKNNEKPVHIGSSIALRLNNNHYILTAAHIMDENVHIDLCIGHKKLLPLQGDFIISKKPDGERNYDRYDFAFQRLSSDSLSSLHDVKFISENDFETQSNSLTPKVGCAIGFPNTKNKSSTISSNEIVSQLLTYSNYIKRDVGTNQNVRSNTVDHFSLGYGKYSTDSDGKKISSISLTGLSGGPLFSLGDLAIPEVLFGQVDPAPKLLGMLVEHVKKEKIILATDINFILNVMRETALT